MKGLFENLFFFKSTSGFKEILLMDSFQFEYPTKAAEITLQEETINLLFTILSHNTLTQCSLALM